MKDNISISNQEPVGEYILQKETYLKNNINFIDIHFLFNNFDMLSHIPGQVPRAPGVRQR